MEKKDRNNGSASVQAPFTPMKTNNFYDIENLESEWELPFGTVASFIDAQEETVLNERKKYAVTDVQEATEKEESRTSELNSYVSFRQELDLRKAGILGEQNKRKRKKAEISADIPEFLSAYTVENGVMIHKETGKVIPDTSIDALHLTTRPYNALRRTKKNGGDILISETIGILCDAEHKTKDLGKKSRQEILDNLQDYLSCCINQEELPVSDTEVEHPEQEKQMALVNDILIEHTALSVRARNSLIHNGVVTVSQLLKVSEEELLKFHQLGEKTIGPILEFQKKLRESAEYRQILPPEQMHEMQIAEMAPVVYNLLREYIVSGMTEEMLHEILQDEAEGSLLSDVLERLLEEGKIQKDTYNRYMPKMQTLQEAMDLYLKEREKAVLEKRIYERCTLNQAAQELNLKTRERIRQLQGRALHNLKKRASRETPIQELRFLRLFETYRMDEAAFRMITGESAATYQLMKLVTHRGECSIEEMREDAELPEWMHRNLNRYLELQEEQDYVILPDDNNRRVRKDRIHVEDYILKRYGDDEITFEAFIGYYNQFLKEHHLEEEIPLCTDAERRYRESRISAHDSILWKYGKRLRYYPIAAREYTELLQTLNLRQYRNIELSTAKFMRDYPELMRQYDIRDEYELHNLLRKIGAEKENETLQFGKMPHICFGAFSRETMIREFLLALAPISAEELAESIHLEYGFAVEQVRGWFGCIDDYYCDGIYSVDYMEMPDWQMNLLMEKLTDDFYYIAEIKRLYHAFFPDQDDTLVSSFNLKRMGFHVNSTYVIKNYANSAAYFRHLLTEHEITDITAYSRRFGELGMYSQILADLKDSYEIIEFEPYQYIHIHRLQQMGITISDIQGFCDSAAAFAEENTYFTMYSLRRSGFTSHLDTLGFGDWFYSSLLREDARFSYVKTGGNVLFYMGRSLITRQTFLIDLMKCLDSSDVSELIVRMQAQYDVKIDRDDLLQCIKDTELHYDAIMDKIYKDYDTYFAEINEIEEDDEYDDFDDEED